MFLCESIEFHISVHSVWQPKRKDGFTAITIFLNLYLIFQFMVRTRSHLENLSKDELIDEVLSLENFKNDINTKLSELNDRFNNFQAKYEIVNSNLSISRRCDEFLIERMTQLERNNLNNDQYNRRETLEINPMSSHIRDDLLEQSVCQALSLTGIWVEQNDMQACHRMKKKDQVMIKFKCRKQKHRVHSNRKSLDLTK